MAQLVKTVGGLAIASIKTVMGLAIASVKTINGLDNTAAGYTTLRENDQTESTGFVATTSGYYWHGSKFTASVTGGDSGVRGKVILRLGKNGSPTGDVICCIFSDSSGVPGSVLTNGTSSTVAVSTIGADTQVEFTGLTPTLSNGTAYWVVMKRPSADGGTNNIKSFQCEYASGPSVLSDSSGSTWASWDAQRRFAFKLYGQ
jgi:hypothetical protein